MTPAAVQVNLTLDRGEVLGLVGESGSGKSSVAMSVPRLLPSPPAFWQEGRILFDGQDTLKMSLADLRKLRGKRIGVVFQDPMGSLSPLHRIGDQLIETVRLHEDISSKAAREMALVWLAKVGIPDPSVRAQAYPHELSGGMQQRVMIAMALMLEPDLLIADEPTTALDVVVQRGILMMLMDLQSKMKNTLVIVSHDMGVHYQITNRMAIMYSGSLMEIGPTEEIFANPLHPYTQMLINALPKVGDKSKREGIAGGPPSLRTPPPGCRFAPRCKMACPECSKSVPEFVQVAPGRYAACHFLKKMEGGKDLNAK